MSKRAILVVDIQNEYFPGGKLPLTGIEEASANAARVIAAARAGGDKVIHIRHEFADPGIGLFTQGTDGVKIHSSVTPQNDEPVIVKNYPNSFLKTDLKDMLDADGIKDVVVIGAMSQMCIEATSRAASDFGYKVTVVHDACATKDWEFNGVTAPAAQVHATAMAALAFAYASLPSTDEYVA